MSTINITKDIVWQYFNKLDDNVIRARCKYCGGLSDIYITLTEVYKHMRDDADNFIKEMKRRMMTETQNAKQSNHTCKICEMLFNQREKYCDHVILQHFSTVIQWETQMHFSHYFNIDNFTIKCNLCEYSFDANISDTIRYHIKNVHANEFNTQRTYDVDSSKCIPLSYMISEITTEKNLWDNYTKLSIFRAECNRCVFERHYINIEENFYKHLLKQHKEVSRYEKEHKNEKPWRYFYYYSTDNVRCLICFNYECPPELNHLNEHMKTHPSKTIDRNCFCDHHWILKYCIESKERNGKTSVKCNVPYCNDKMNLEFNFGLFSEHTVQHQAEPSGETLSKKTKRELQLSPFQFHIQKHQDEVGSSENQQIKTEKDLWDNYQKLSIFRAKCKQCDVFERHYIKIYGNIYQHLLKKHEEIYRYEKEHETEKLWQYFCYYSEDNVRCLICINFECSSELNNLKEHIEVHISETINFKCFNRHWILKYCVEKKERNGKTSVKCNVPNCNDNMEFEFNFGPFSEHIIQQHQNEVEPSGETPLKKTKKDDSSKD